MAARKTASPGMRLNIKTVRFGDLKKYKNNPRNNEEAIPYLKESLDKFNYQQPIVVTKDNEIVAGHTRLEALKKLGHTDDELIDVQVFNGTADEAKAYRLVDNKVPEFSGWDFEKLDVEVADIDMDLEPFGIEAFEDDGNVVNTADTGDGEVEETEVVPAETEKAKTIVCPHCGETIYL